LRPAFIPNGRGSPFESFTDRLTSKPVVLFCGLTVVRYWKKPAALKPEGERDRQDCSPGRGKCPSASHESGAGAAFSGTNAAARSERTGGGLGVHRDGGGRQDS
jgi:hypothetical protein